MWILESTKTGTKYHLLAGIEYSVGRKDNDILLLNDPSISRNHAKIVVSEDEIICRVVDLKSKYGTHCGDNKVTSDGCGVRSGDRITFGLCGNEFEVKNETLLVTTSCLNKKQKKELDAITKLGGRVVSHFEPKCQYLVMTGIKVTTKAISAMISQKPIVTLQFFIDWWKSAQLKQPLPNPSDYLPPIEDPHINPSKVSFHPLKTREGIFSGKMFVFFDPKQQQKLNEVLVLGGAKVVFYNNDIIESLIHPGTCVMDVLPDGSSSQENTQVMNQVTEVRNYLKRHGRRLIPESDIGYAVVFASTKEYCNPEFSFGSAILTNKLLVSQALTQKEVYIQSTVPEHITEAKNTNAQITDVSKDAASDVKPNASSMESVPPSFEAEVSETVSKVTETFATTVSLSQRTNRLKRQREQCAKEANAEIFSKSLRLESEDFSIKTAVESVTEVAESPQHESSTDYDQLRIKQEPITPACTQEVVYETLYDAGLNKADDVDDASRVADKTSNKRSLADINVEMNEAMTSKRSRHSNLNSFKLVSQNAKQGNSTVENTSAGRKSCLGYDYLTSGLPHTKIKEEPEEEGDATKYVCALINVISKPLVVRKPGQFAMTTVTTETGKVVKNVKKFKKVQPISSRVLPRIIGGHDLVNPQSHEIEEVWNSRNTSTSKTNGHLIDKNSDEESNRNFESEEEETEMPKNPFVWD